MTMRNELKIHFDTKCTLLLLIILIFTSAISAGEVSPDEARKKPLGSFHLPADYHPDPGLVRDVESRFMGVSWGVRKLRGVEFPAMQGTHPIWVVQADKEMLVNRDIHNFLGLPILFRVLSNPISLTFLLIQI